MNLISNLCSSLCPDLKGRSRETERAIDASVRLPVLGFIKASAFWLVVSTLFGLIASIKLHSPEFMSDCAAMSYGVVRPIFWNALIYGFVFQAGLACSTWILARLSGNPVGNAPLLTISSAFWNVGVIVGLVGIFLGHQNPYEWLEFPAYVAPFLWIAFMGIAVWGMLTFKSRAHRASYASQWYILAALMAFAWIYTVVEVMLFCAPVQGVYQSLVNWWYVDNLIGLVLVPFALATVYYLLPKTLGVSIVGYRYSGIAFWTWMACSAFRGSSELLNGPVPAWVSGLGVIATFSILIPATTLSIQFLSTLFANFSKIWDSVAARYIFLGVISFTLYCILEISSSLRSTSDVVQFSVYDTGVKQLLIFGFIGMTCLGGIYFILPRILNKNLPTSIVEMQFWISALGVVSTTVGLVLGGLEQGALLNQSTASLETIAQNSKSFLFLNTLGMTFLLFGGVAFSVTFVWMLIADRSKKEESTKLIKSAPELEYTAS